MKNRIVVLLAPIAIGVVLSACSTPKYTYYFDHQSHKSKEIQTDPVVGSVLDSDPQALQASAKPVVTQRSLDIPVSGRPLVRLDKSARKAAHNDLGKDHTTRVTPQKRQGSVESAMAAQSMDKELKLAIVFGAVGVAGILIGTSVFSIIGSIALLIGVVFFVKWIIRQ